MRAFGKPVIDITGQIQLLKQRGPLIQDEALASSFLQAVNFFRLTSYVRTFANPMGFLNIRAGTRSGSQPCNFKPKKTAPLRGFFLPAISLYLGNA